MKTKMLAVGYLVGISIILPNISNALSAYRIEGTISFQKTGANPISKYDVSFTTIIAGCQWRILLESSKFKCDYYEVSCDGTNTYYLSSIVKWFNTQRAAGATNIGDNVASGIVRRSPVPAFNFAHHAGAVWQAYCSGCYFDHLGTNKIAAVPATLGILNGRDAMPNDFVRQHVELTTIPNDLAVPRRVVYFDSSGVESSVFQLESETNHLEGVFPQSARFQVFSKIVAGKESQESVYEYEVTTRSITQIPLAPQEEFKPVIPGLTVFSDERFNTPEQRPNSKYQLHFTYMATNWYSDAQVKELPQYKAQLSYSEGKRPFNKKTFIVIFLLISFVLLPWIFWSKQFQKKETA